MACDILKSLEGQGQRMKIYLTDIERALGGNNALARLAEDMSQHNKLLSATYGPMYELRRSGAFGGLAEIREQRAAMKQLQDQLAETALRFRLPEIDQATALMESYLASDAPELVKQLHDQQDYIQRAINAMRIPWLNVEHQMRSASALAALQSIGFALQNIPTFDDRLTELLRVGLGDWQDHIDIPQAVFEDPLSRSAFYQERGFDPALTAFPTEAFERSLDLAGLRSEVPKIIDAYDYEEVTEHNEQEIAFARTNAAHDRLQRFESQLRKFIDEQMRKAIGDQWIKRRLPGDIHKRWVEKREKARAAGEADHPLIAYADFSDYLTIIVQKNNWNEVFVPFFSRQTSVQESFQRLYPIRICTMHARMITQEDELYLYVETTRVLKAIGL